MLIRTQDRDALINVDQASVIWASPAGQLGRYAINVAFCDSGQTEPFRVGIYSNADRAFEVLGEIERYYREYACRYGHDCSDVAVYDMPPEVTPG